MTSSRDAGRAAQGLEAELEEEDGMAIDEGYEDDEGSQGEEDEESASGSDHDPLIPEWSSLDNHPPETANGIREILRKLAARGKNRLSMLIIGRAGVGKSHTANSLYAERVAQVVPFHMVSYTNVQPVVVRKKSQGVVFTAIDTPGLVETDGVSEVNLRRIAYQTKNNPVDIIIYVDRLDMKTDDLDIQVFEGINRTFGSEVWSRVLIGLTKSELRAPPPGVTYEEVVAARVENLRAGMRQAGAKYAPLPYTLIENSVRCRTDENTGEKILPNGQNWITAFFDTAVNLALANPGSGLCYEPGAAERSSKLMKRFVFVPLAILAQVVFKIFVLDRIIEDDGTKRDQYGPFDPATVEFEKEKLRDRKDQEREQRSLARRKAGRMRTKGKQSIEGTFGVDTSSDEDDDDNDFFDDT